MGLLCVIPFLAPFFAACLPEPPLAVGYVEGEFVLIAPVETARISSVQIHRGERIAVGQVLAAMESRDAEIALNQAQAGLARAKSQLADLKQGRRPAELSLIEASVASARTQLAEANRELGRQTDLFDRGVIAQAQLDLAGTNQVVMAAKVTELEASLAVARLPARADQIEAAVAAVAQQESVLENAQWRLDERSLSSPVSGLVADIFRYRGENAGPQSPVLSILPDDGIKLRVYMPEKALSRLEIGTVLKVGCDGCGSNLEARVSFISDHPEFTPPVIYSLDARQKLVFLVEARPIGEAALKPGQIVDVKLGELVE